MTSLNSRRQSKTLWVMVLIGAFMFYLSSVSGWSNNTFNGTGQSIENLTFTGNQNFTRWLSIPQNTILTKGFLNLSGYGLFANINSSHNSRLTLTETANSAKSGAKITIGGNNITLYSINKSSLSTANMSYILNSAKGIIANASFSGDIAIFSSPQNLTFNTTYYLAVDKQGAVFTSVYNNTVIFNISGNSFNWTGGLDTAGGDSIGAIFNLLSIDTSSYLTNPSLSIGNINVWNYSNSSGLFFIEGHGIGFDTSETANSAKSGMRIQTGMSNITIQSINKSSLSTANMSYILNSAKGIIANASFSGDIAIFSSPQNLTFNTTYYLAVDKQGAVYTTRYVGDGGYNISGKYLNWTGGLDTIANDTNGAFNILSVNISIGTGIFNQTNNRTNNLASIINLYLNSTYLIGTNYLIPFIFHSDTAGILQYLDLLFSNEGFLENNRTYNSSTYETSTESFLTNVTYDSSAYSSIVGSLYYDGTGYTGTKTGGGNEAIFTRSITIPTITSQSNKTFYWQIGLTNSSGVNYYNSTFYNQTVSNITLSLCNATVTVPFLNFTFKDEADSSVINASNDLTDFDYWLGGGSVTKEYITSNTSNHYSYGFCFTPADKTLNVDLTFKYSKSGYPLRTFQYDSKALTNSTTNQGLYLLGSSSGIYSSIQAVTSGGIPISGVEVTAEKQFSGVYSIIEQGVTDSSGLVTFWVNPNFDHRITAVKSGYSTAQVVIRPSQSVYTLQMSSSTGNASYTTDISGIYWNLLPSSGTISTGAHNFNVSVYSSESNLENCKLEIVNASNLSQILISDTSITNSSYCFVDVDYTVQTGDRLFGRLAVDTTSTTGFVYVDTDWKWIALDKNVSTWTTITSFFQDLKDLSEFGSGNEAEYSRFMFFFLITTIVMGVFIFFSGVELSNPGVTLFIIWCLVFLATAGGFFTIDSGSNNVNSVIEQWGIFFILTLFVLGFSLNAIRRYTE